MECKGTRREFLAATAAIAAGSAAKVDAREERTRNVSTIANIVTVCQEGLRKDSVEANRDQMLSVVDSALRQKPDLICLPETFTDAGHSTPLEKRAESIPGPTTDAFARKAKEGRCYIVCPIQTRAGSVIHNSAVVLDRFGHVCGVYNKVCPVTSSPEYTTLEDGVTPGDSIPTFDLDFGRIGLQICFDVGFPENWQKLADAGVRAVLWPSAYDGGFPLRVFAYLHHYWVISATRTGKSRIIDPCGEILSETGSGSLWVSRRCNMDYVVSHWDFNMGVADRIRAKYASRVDVRAWDPGSAHFIVEPTDPSIATEDLQREFGFESTTLYHNRHRTAYAQIRKGEAPAPQAALHGKRAQWGK